MLRLLLLLATSTVITLPAAPVFTGNDPCRTCHAAIAKAYEATPMARSTAPVKAANVPSGAYKHPASGLEYRIAANGRVTIRDAAAGISHQQQFDYVVGSGSAGFSYLISRDRWLYQAPITWYAQKQRWAASPGYDADRTMAWDRPIDPSCLNCHASQLTHIYGTRNRYAAEPFRQPGISCERCHGPGSEHVQSSGRQRLAVPSKLDPERRDDVCRQCHLMGEARIPRAGRAFGEFRAGQKLSEFVAYFVLDYPAGARLRSTSHVEKFAESACKKASGDKMWCGSCHDVHTTPADPVAWYRQKCQACHAPPASGKVASECPRTPNCIACHMPKLQAVDAGHGAFTDHAIQRRPATQTTNPPQPPWHLRPFSPADAGTRELGAAYLEIFSRTGDARQRDEALRLARDLAPK